MKYPQLVSPRAVNAISDWLVSRLEQLGVESPQIYTRLLLSLLQSSVQINDPIEFSNLEAFFSNRKGGHKRFHLPSDTETLKKLNAVHCLREIVSNEHETATIEKLIEELCEKLNDIEKQTQNLNDEERFLIETNLNKDTLQQQFHTQLQQQQHHCSSNNNPHHHNRHHKHPHHQQEQQVSHGCNNTNNAALNIGTNTNTTITTTTTTSDDLNDLDNDPKKRYFRAFPALSKEMEDSFRIWRRNAKSLTWPVVGRSIVANNNLNNSSASLSSSSASSTVSSSNFGACSSSVPTDKSVDKKVSSGCVGNIGVSETQQGTTATSVKKKSKRRRNQAVCKGKNIQNIRKVSFGTASNSVGANKYHHYTHHRNSSSPAWDTDFKGCWEMGPDLIKEFISSQNGNKKHNRSNSDGVDQREQREHKLLYEVSTKTDDKTIMKSYIDLSFCCDDDDDDINFHSGKTQHQYTEEGLDYFDEDYDDNTLASMSELTMDNFNQKRLYQREGNTQKTLAFGGIVLIGNSAVDKNLDDVADSVDPLDFQQFKSKFNSSVEALWKDVAPTPTNGPQQSTAKIQNGENPLKLHNQLGGGDISSAFYATTSLNALAPFKRDLWNFWSNYQQKNYDQLNNKISTSASTSSMITTTHFDDSSASSGVGGDNTNSSDYFSMPSNLDDFDKSVGSIRRTTEPGASFGLHTPSINVFLQNSIWSTSADGTDVIGSHSVPTAADTDESFLFRVWQSNKKLSEIDVGNAVNGNKVDNDGVNVINNDFNKSNEPSSFMMNNPNLDASLQFPSYQNLKWSEGINAGPPYGSLQTHAFVSHHNGMLSSLRADNNFASFGSVAGISGATWRAPTWGQNAQPDLRSWCACNPISLTEMYGNDVCDSIVNQSPVEEEGQHQSEMGMGPAITLPNHSVSSSGFVAYSRIKQCGLVQPQIKPLQTSTASRLPKDLFRSSEEENLLTSERTHFHPIENFVDGHTFDISTDLDTVEFERTPSGLMRYDSEEYLEYTRNDIYMADEEVSTSSTNLLKFSKKPIKDKSDMFVIKFRVKRSGETACQTEEHDLKLAAAKMAEVSTAAASLGIFPSSFEVNNMFQNTFSLSRQANNEAIMAAVTKAVAAAAKAAAENHLNAGHHFCWLPITSTLTNTTASNTCTNTRENNLIWRPDSSIGDEVDFCKIDKSVSRHQQQLAQSWSRQEVEKQCHQRQCFPPQEQEKAIESKVQATSNQQRSEENSLDNASLHTLWGMCAVCNSCEYGKSLPADRLLRDELHLEADEIMSDLRYMQDLYIGESDILNETNEVQRTEEKDVAIDNKMDCYSKDIDINSLHNPWNKNKENDPAKVSMLKKVNQLIEDLLKTENTGKLPKDSNEHDKIISQTQLSNFCNLQADQGKTKNLWQFVEQEHNNVWQHTSLVKQFQLGSGQNKKEFVKPMNLLKQVGDSFNEDAQYMENLNWEHNNLAKIWQQSTPVQLEETLINPKQNEMAGKHNRIFNEQEETIEGCQKLVNEKNLKNLQNSNDSTPPPPNLPPNTYKRVQQLFNNSAAKMKLIANRKRRHSASQNFYQQQHLQYNISGNGNSNDIITDLNDTLKAAEEEQEQQPQQHQQDISPHNNASLLSCINAEEQQPAKQTIITCKYWTTATNGTQSSLDSAAAAMMLLAAATNTNHADMIAATTTDNYDQEDSILDENICSNTFSCLIDKNASILKHVTMMTRPLTR